MGSFYEAGSKIFVGLDPFVISCTFYNYFENLVWIIKRDKNDDIVVLFQQSQFQIFDVKMSFFISHSYFA